VKSVKLYSKSVTISCKDYSVFTWEQSNHELGYNIDRKNISVIDDFENAQRYAK